MSGKILSAFRGVIAERRTAEEVQSRQQQGKADRLLRISNAISEMLKQLGGQPEGKVLLESLFKKGGGRIHFAMVRYYTYFQAHGYRPMREETQRISLLISPLDNGEYDIRIVAKSPAGDILPGQCIPDDEFLKRLQKLVNNQKRFIEALFAINEHSLPIDLAQW